MYIMLVTHILQIYTLLKKTVHCPKCHRISNTDEIEIVDLCEDECTFSLYCDHCDISIDADVIMYDNGQAPSINISSHEKVTEADVELVSKTLSTHKGSLKKLFGKVGPEKK